MIKRYLIPVAAVLLTTGCATNSGLYNWGNYEEDLFTYYHKPELKEKVVASHIAFINELEQANKKPPPGLLAEAGTLLLQEGDRQGALAFYQREHDIWPESRPMMSALIQNLKEQ